MTVGWLFLSKIQAVDWVLIYLNSDSWKRIDGMVCVTHPVKGCSEGIAACKVEVKLTSQFYLCLDMIYEL
ncbi:hypothetical protein QVD17_05382 [Tagetes erecta]|uniref:F-box protein n=1 Tax=Tagetes erecta TaxID=13708 RepID=A0AAD8PBG9_TARER|nr:hypothetical protein QVD17_05382 [Tagetes erecta]